MQHEQPCLRCGRSRLSACRLGPFCLHCGDLVREARRRAEQIAPLVHRSAALLWRLRLYLAPPAADRPHEPRAALEQELAALENEAAAFAESLMVLRLSARESHTRPEDAPALVALI